jgi:hypothetical protein
MCWKKLSRDPDSDVRMWVACNPMTPERVLGELAEDSVVFVRRGVAQNKSTPAAVLARLNEDADFSVRALAHRNRSKTHIFLFTVTDEEDADALGGAFSFFAPLVFLDAKGTRRSSVLDPGRGRANVKSATPVSLVYLILSQILSESEQSKQVPRPITFS